MTKKFYESLDLKSNALLDVSSVQLAADASGDDHAVRKLQAEQIAANAVQAQIVGSLAQAASSNSFSADFTKAQLATKQPTMVIDASSNAFLEIVDGYKIKLKDLGITSTHKASESSLAQFIANSAFNGNGTLTHDGETLDGMTFIFMESATLPAERSVIYLGTNNGNADDFVAFGVDYNSNEIRTFFSGTGTGLNYDVGTGQFSLQYGNGSGSIGAHSIPVSSSEFSTVTGSTVLAVLKALETLVSGQSNTQASATATVDTRCSSLLGTSSSSDMGSFDGSTLDAGKNLKELMQQVETLIEQATADRAAVAAAASAATGVVQGDLTAETNSRVAADAALSNEINAEASARVQGDAYNSIAIVVEQNRATAAETVLDGRLDVVEGVGEGSVSKAKTDAIAAANVITFSTVANETNRSLAAEAALQATLDNLAEGDLRFIGLIGAGGLISMRAEMIAIESPSSRNGLLIDDVYLNAGEIWVANADVTITFGDSSTLVLENGDRLLAVVDALAGAVTSSSFNVVQADSSAISVANVDGVRVELNASGDLDIADDSVIRSKLSVDIRSELDDTRSLTESNSISSPSDTHMVVSTDLDAQQNVHWKRTQSGGGVLTGTVRATLAELYVNSNGSTSPVAPSAAHVTTHACHYDGGCVDMSLIIAGGNFEAVGKAGTQVVATGLYASSVAPQDGVNIGLAAIADGSTFSNCGVVGFAGTESTGTHRGIVATVSALTVENYNFVRGSDPFPHARVALVADAKTAPAGSKAFYAYGDVVFEGGDVEFNSAPTADNHPVRLTDVKAKEAIFEFNLTDNVQRAITCTLDLTKCMIAVVHGDDDVEVTVIRDATNNQLLVKAQGGNLQNCRILVQELRCDVTPA